MFLPTASKWFPAPNCSSCCTLTGWFALSGAPSQCWPKPSTPKWCVLHAELHTQHILISTSFPCRVNLFWFSRRRQWILPFYLLFLRFSLSALDGHYFLISVRFMLTADIVRIQLNALLDEVDIRSLLQLILTLGNHITFFWQHCKWTPSALFLNHNVLYFKFLCAVWVMVCMCVCGSSSWSDWGGLCSVPASWVSESWTFLLPMRLQAVHSRNLTLSHWQI